MLVPCIFAAAAATQARTAALSSGKLAPSSVAMDAAESACHRRRIEKRLESIQIVKGTANYLSYAARVSRPDRTRGEPRTPSPGGSSISTRQFRYRIKVWKQSLYEWNVRMAALE